MLYRCSENLLSNDGLLKMLVWRIDDLYVMIAVREVHLGVVMWSRGKDSSIEVLIIERVYWLFY